jgi:lysozyme
VTDPVISIYKCGLESLTTDQKGIPVKLSKRGAAFVGAHEGWRSRYYLDPVGIPTIGYGFTWRSAAFKRWWAKNRSQAFGPSATLTRQEGTEILSLLFDEEYGAAVNAFLGKDVPQHVFDAMASVTFNCGPGCLKWKWAQAAKAGDYARAASLLRTTAVTARGKRLPGLVRRRAEEAELLLHGAYHSIEIVADRSGILSKGSRGGGVLSLQTKLQALGFYDGKLDGVYGVGTEAAVLAFQQAKSIAADGVAGPVTLSALDDAKPTQKPTEAPKPSASPAAAPAAAVAAGGLLWAFWNDISSWIGSFF